MISAPRSSLILMLPALLLCFLNTVDAIPTYDRRPRPPSSSSPSPSPTSCTPTATATIPATLTFNQHPIGYPGDNTALIFGPGWLYVACVTYQDNSCSGDCVSPCCNKGICGPSVTATDLLLSPSDGDTYLSVTPRAPAVAFTFFTITFTAANFGKSESVTVELKGTYVDGTILPTKSVIIPKPGYGQFYSSVTKNLPVDLGLGDVKELKFTSYYTGGEKKVPAEVRLDSDGTGTGINYETCTLLGCEKSGEYGKRDISVPVGKVLVRGTLAGNE